jgi:hypothetical protein
MTCQTLCHILLVDLFFKNMLQYLPRGIPGGRGFERARSNGRESLLAVDGILRDRTRPMWLRLQIQAPNRKGGMITFRMP